MKSEPQPYLVLGSSQTLDFAYAQDQKLIGHGQVRDYPGPDGLFKWTLP